MRFCCNDTGIDIFRNMEGNERKLKKLRAIGFRVFGVSGVADAGEDDILRFRELAAKDDMVVGMSPTGYQPAHPDPEMRKQHHEDLKKTLRNMQKLGGDLIHIAGGSYSGDGWWHHPKNFTQQGMDELIDEMKKIAPYAEDAEVCIAPETTQWCILHSPERMKEFVDRVNSPYVKVTFDIVNHMRADRIYESGRFFRCVLAMLGNRIGQLHVKDVDVTKGLVVHINEVPLGTGLIDHETIVKASKDLEPWMLFSLEHFNEKDVDRYIQIERGYKHFQRIADSIGHSWTDPHMTRKTWERGRSGLR